MNSGRAINYTDERTTVLEHVLRSELGLIVCLLVPQLAATASLKDVHFGGVNYLLLLSLGLPLALFVLVLVKASMDRTRVTLWPGHRVWLVWFAVIWSSLIWSEVRDGEAIKHAMEMTAPIFFAVAGGMFIRTTQQLSWLLNSILISMLVGIACVAGWKIGILDFGDFSSGPAIDPRPHSMSFIPIAALALALIPSRLLIPIAVWSCCLLLSAVEGSRGVTLCLLLMPLFHPGFRGLHWRLLMALAVVAMALIVFYLPPMQERLFPDSGSGTIGDLLQSKQSGMGRFEAWPLVLDRALEAPVLGHGVSSVFHYVPTIWDRMRSPHNEFLCIGYEFGLIGLLVYGCVMFHQLRLLRTAARHSSGPIALAFMTVYLGLIAFNVMACTDNPLSSNVRFLNPLFLLMGAAFAISQRQNLTARDSVRISIEKS